MKENKFIHRFHNLPSGSRLLFSLVFAGLIFLLVKNKSVPVQFMSVWVAFAVSNLILFWVTITTANPDEIKNIARKQDSSRALIFLVVIFASVISLFAIILLFRDLPNAKEAGYYFHVLLSIVSVISSWGLIHTIFAFRYAHLYFTSKLVDDGIKKEHVGGLIFPDDDKPDYLDFAYFSFVIGMTFQVSDVQISSTHIRRLALMHGLLSFGYNTVIVALTINIISGVIQN